MCFTVFQEARENETDEIREKLSSQKSALEERIIKEKQVNLENKKVSSLQRLLCLSKCIPSHHSFYIFLVVGTQR